MTNEVAPGGQREPTSGNPAAPDNTRGRSARPYRFPMGDNNIKWYEADVPDQTGRVAIVTGANTGLGFETARVPAAHGARVVLAVRNVENGNAAASRIIGVCPRADVAVAPPRYEPSNFSRIETPTKLCR